MVEGFVFVEKQRRIEVGLAGSQETLPSKMSRVIWVVIREEHMLVEEVISLEVLLLRRDSSAWAEEFHSKSSQPQE